MKNIMTKRNGIIAATVAVVVIAAIVITTSMSSALTEDKAKEIAAKHVPATAAFTASEEEETKFEVYFYDSAAKESYEVEINKETQAVRKIETQLDNDRGGKTVKLTKAQAKQIAANKFAGIVSSTATLNMEDGLYEYQVNFKANDFYGNMDINAETGAILESVIKYGSAVTIPTDQSGSSDIISYEKAMDAATALVGGGTVKDIDLDTERGEYVYEIEVVKNGIEYEVIVNATTGKAVLEGEHENHIDSSLSGGTETTKPNSNTGGNNSGTAGSTSGSDSSSGRISESKAKSIVLDKLPGATILYIELERDDGLWVYEGEATKGEYEYEFEIDAETGMIIGWDKERLEKYDDRDDDDWDDDDHDEDWDD